MGMIAGVVGATGLVGREVVAQLCSDTTVKSVHVFVRGAWNDSDTACIPKLVSHVVDFNQLASTPWPACDVLFCCLGTTIKSAGSRNAFRKVDVDYVVQSAYQARAAGATSLIVVSALGAHPQSKVFYNRTKGEMEAEVAALGFERVVIVRPSLLEGIRAKPRIAERLALAASRFINPILLPDIAPCRLGPSPTPWSRQPKQIPLV
jgi:uncharacterized protein YbjT (DUF2867 family)